MQQPDEKSAEIAAQFAEMHEEYLTDWSLSKAEKWTFHEVDNCAARSARVGSPLHTDSESDGSEDMEDALDEKCVRRKAPGAGFRSWCSCRCVWASMLWQRMSIFNVFTPQQLQWCMCCHKVLV